MGVGVAAFGPSSVELLWNVSFDYTDMIQAAPVVAEGMVYVATDGHHLLAIDVRPLELIADAGGRAARLLSLCIHLYHFVWLHTFGIHT